MLRNGQFRQVEVVGALVAIVFASGVVAAVATLGAAVPVQVAVAPPVVVLPPFEPCADRTDQVPGDPYSPPCVVATGPAPVAVGPGVTASEVVVSYAPLYGDDPLEVAQTTAALAEYFNGAFELHGRRLRLVERGTAPAVFADLTADVTTGAPLDLAARGIVGLGGYGWSEAELGAARPFLWSAPSSCSPLYAAAVDAAIDASATDGGAAVAVVDPYIVDHGCLSNADRTRLAAVVRIDHPADAAAVVERLRTLDATAVVVGTYPSTTAALVDASVAAGIAPQWVAAEPSLVLDLVARSFDPEGWRGALGFTAANPAGGTMAPGYAAYRSVRPEGEPALTVEAIYDRLHLLASGIQMAGPDLDPATFEAGLRRLPPRMGPLGQRDLRAGHSAIAAPMAFAWDGAAEAPVPGRPGTWVALAPAPAADRGQLTVSSATMPWAKWGAPPGTEGGAPPEAWAAAR